MSNPHYEEYARRVPSIMDKLEAGVQDEFQRAIDTVQSVVTDVESGYQLLGMYTFLQPRLRNEGQLENLRQQGLKEPVIDAVWAIDAYTEAPLAYIEQDPELREWFGGRETAATYLRGGNPGNVINEALRAIENAQ